MTSIFDCDCERVRSLLDAFVDGELRGVDRLAVAQHLETCAECANEEQELRGIGNLLRDHAVTAPRVDLSGLSGGVVSRVRAEQAQSWRVLMARAVEDWHWALVGAGSLTAGAFSILFVSALLWWGPAPSRPDSLEALLNNLSAPAGTLLLVTDRSSMPLRFESGSLDGAEDYVTVPVSFAPLEEPSEVDLTRDLSAAMIGADGRVSNLDGMSRVARQRTEALLDQIQKQHFGYGVPATGASAGWSSSPVGVVRFGLVISTIVTGKALTP